MEVRFRFANDAARDVYGGRPPAYATSGSAGVDLRVVSYDVEMIASEPVYWCRSGIIAEIPTGYFGLIVPRSSARMRLVNTAGLMELLPSQTLDTNGMPYVATRPDRRFQTGQRLCQLIITPCLRADWIEADALSETSRGAGGFGSTGK